MRQGIFCVLLLISFNTRAQSDFIVAGQTTDVVYSDIAPDLGGHIVIDDTLHYAGTYDYLLNLNNAGPPDFKIELSTFTGLGGSSNYSSITALDSTNKIAFTLDTIICYPWDTMNGYVPTVNLGDSIKAGDTVKVADYEWSSTATLSSGRYMVNYGPCESGAWKDHLVHFAGLMMPNNGDTILGWVRMKITNSVTYQNDSVVFYDYAATKGFGIGIQEISNPLQVKIFPNPVNSSMEVYSSEAGHFALLTSVGGKLKQGTLKKGTNILDVSNLLSGYYILVVQRFGDKNFTRLPVVKL